MFLWFSVVTLSYLFDNNLELLDTSNTFKYLLSVNHWSLKCEQLISSSVIPGNHAHSEVSNSHIQLLEGLQVRTHEEGYTTIK